MPHGMQAKVSFLTLALLASPAIALDVRKMDDGTQIYEFETGVKCYKRADYEKHIKADGSVTIKKIFSLGGSLSNNISKLRDVSPQAQEFEALLFDLCFEHGTGRLTLEQYHAKREELLEVRTMVLSGSDSEADGGSGDAVKEDKSTVLHTEGNKSPGLQNVEGDVNMTIE